MSENKHEKSLRAAVWCSELLVCPWCGQLPRVEERHISFETGRGKTYAMCDTVGCPLYAITLPIDGWNSRVAG